MNCQTSTKQAKSQPNKTMAESAKNISATKRLLKIKTCKIPAISSQLVARKPLELATRRQETSSEEVGTIRKNNLTGITLGKPIWGIRSLTLIISWKHPWFYRSVICSCNRLSVHRVPRIPISPQVLPWDFQFKELSRTNLGGITFELRPVSGDKLS